MTLITAFPYREGIVLSADSQETVTDEHGDEFKYSVLKLVPERMGNFQLLVAGGGNGEAVEAFIETLRTVLADSRIKTLPKLKELIQSQLIKFRRKLKSVGDDPKMHLFIAAHIDTSYEIWKTDAYVLAKVDKPDMIGFTAHLYRHVMKEFSPTTLPAQQLVLLSPRILELARETSTCIDQPYSVVIVRDNGIHTLDDVYVKQCTEMTKLFGASVNSLFLACGDISMGKDTFSKRMEEFNATVLQLRDDYLQEIATRAFARAMEPGYRGDPINLMPSTIMTVYGDGRSIAREQTEQERQQMRERFEAARTDSGKLELAKFNQMMKDRQVLYFNTEAKIKLKPRLPAPVQPNQPQSEK